MGGSLMTMDWPYSTVRSWTKDHFSTTTTSDNTAGHLFKRATWAPDGSSIVSLTEDNTLNWFILPPDILSVENAPMVPLSARTVSSEVRCFSVYPQMALSAPSTCAVGVSHRDNPVHLLDTFKFNVQASYSLIDARNEKFIAPHCLGFTGYGDSLVCGSVGGLSLFATMRPGKDVLLRIPLNNSQDKRSIVSALAASPVHADVLAFGTFRAGQVYIASTTSGTIQHEIATANQAGVVQVVWSHCGRYLYVVSRRSDYIECIDVRNLHTTKLLGFKGQTNQRIYASLNPRNDNLIAGGTHGKCCIWNNNDIVYGNNTQIHPSCSTTVACSSTVSSVEFNPLDPSIILTTCGDRSGLDSYLEVSSSSSSWPSTTSSEVTTAATTRQILDS